MCEDRPSGLHVILKIMTDGPTVDLISEKANWPSAYADVVSETVTDGPSPLCLDLEKATDGPSPPWSRGRLWMGPEHADLFAKMVADGLNVLGRDSGIDPSTHDCGIGKGDGWARSSYIAENGGARRFGLGEGDGWTQLVCIPENGDGCVQHICCMLARGYGWTIRHIPWECSLGKCLTAAGFYMNPLVVGIPTTVESHMREPSVGLL
ncbi:uncharacterized protein F5891DRAFT_985906 [Suillus fuscotomentosus]|uniref:Uncharacterized protein n=1 Tax=Suillus fuscotomentosus TaxID=1912939 RepID=A0AAD4HEN4_9AGAM|nr:uncharacterized protein F5891DRAFT_985906 [Suillus fuscotomentosus]KAG1893396.1 hypothetical protein F5891DRAFT_985906 [Suillus fuscotomentosus]